MAIKMVRAIVQDNKHIETKQSIQGLRRGQEVEVLIYFHKAAELKGKDFSFTDHDFGEWRGGQMRREEIYHENGR